MIAYKSHKYKYNLCRLSVKFLSSSCEYRELLSVRNLRPYLLLHAFNNYLRLTFIINAYTKYITRTL